MMEDNIVSFITDESKPKKRKFQYKKVRPPVEYSSGSDGDVDSDSDTVSPGTKKVKRKRKSVGKTEEVVASKKAGEEAGRSGEEEDEMGSDDDVQSEKPIPGAGWADAMSKILGRPATTTTKPIVLSRSKAYKKAKDAQKEETVKKQNLAQEKRIKVNMGREIPQPLKKDFERNLVKIATRGVVQLFNAVEKRQKLREDMLKEAGGSERKREKAEASFSKGEFLDMLKGGYANTDTEPRKMTSEKEKPAWSVLKDNFMMGATMKDWDKEEGNQEKEEGDKNVEETSSSESDDNSD